MVAGVTHGAAADGTEDMLKTNTSALAPVLAALALTAGCSDLQDDAVLAQAAATDTAYVNGRIYTQDEDRPWAESLVTKGDRIVFVGSDEEALEHAAEDARLVDLQHRLVKTGGPLVKQGRDYWLLLAEGHLHRRLFSDMLRRFWALSLPAG